MAKEVVKIEISASIFQELSIEANCRKISLAEVIECHHIMSKMDSYYQDEKFQKIFREFKEDIFAKAGTFDDELSTAEQLQRRGVTAKYI